MNRLLSFLFGLIPIRKKKVLFISHLGKGYGCNPKYLCEYLRLCHRDEFELHWVFDPVYSAGKDIPNGVVPVSLYSHKFAYDILTCAFLISNTRLPEWFGFKNRKGQNYIQTWHSSLRLKKIEGDANLGLAYETMAKSDSLKTSIIVSGCKFSSDIYNKAFWYSGPLLEVGTPRIDFLLNQTESGRNQLFEKVGLDSKYRYVLYAPTFRDNGKTEVYDINYQKLVVSMNHYLGGEWKVLCKLHPNLLGKIDLNNLPSVCIDVSYYNDIQELLIVSDILITDFSSCMFDMAFLRKPCFLYASDLDKYISTERDLYFDIKSLPFPLATSNLELLTIVSHFQLNDYLEKIESFMIRIGSFENGTACESIYRYMISH